MKLWRPVLVRWFVLPVTFILYPLYGLAQGLPEPLTLEAALKYADNTDHFQVHLSDESIRESIAAAEQIESINGVKVNLSGQIRQVGIPSTSNTTEENDSALHLFVRKPLYDFGKSSRRESLAELNVELKQLERQYLIEQRELSITQKYFDVLNADNDFIRQNEDLSIWFIRMDRTRERKELGLASDLDLLESQAVYEVVRQTRYNSEHLQRLTRTLLAEELGFPNSPPNNMSTPELRSDTKITDDVEALIQRAYQHSLKMAIQQKQLTISKKALEIAEDVSGPKIDAELQVSDYARPSIYRDDWRASIYFDVPLYDGSAEKSAKKQALAKYQQSLSELQKVRSDIRLTVLQLWQSILQSSLRLSGNIINQDYRDMYLDRSRAEYELEFQTDLGDAMVQYSDSRKQMYQSRYDLELAWRKLEKLVGRDYLDQLKTSKVNDTQ